MIIVLVLLGIAGIAGGYMCAWFGLKILLLKNISKKARITGAIIEFTLAIAEFVLAYVFLSLIGK